MVAFADRLFAPMLVTIYPVLTISPTKLIPVTYKKELYPIRSTAYNKLLPALYWKDVFWGGKGRVYGTVKIDDSPDYPVRKRVLLIREREGTTVREQWSDAITGMYDFINIDENEKYSTIALDETLEFPAVIADNLIPEV